MDANACVYQKLKKVMLVGYISTLIAADTFQSKRAMYALHGVIQSKRGLTCFTRCFQYRVFQRAHMKKQTFLNRFPFPFGITVSRFPNWGSGIWCKFACFPSVFFVVSSSAGFLGFLRNGTIL